MSQRQEYTWKDRRNLPIFASIGYFFPSENSHKLESFFPTPNNRERKLILSIKKTVIKPIPMISPLEMPDLIRTICKSCDPISRYNMSRTCREWSTWTNDIAPINQWVASTSDDADMDISPYTEYRIAAEFERLKNIPRNCANSADYALFITRFLTGTSIATHSNLHTLMYDYTVRGKGSGFKWRIIPAITKALLASIADVDTLSYWVFLRDFLATRWNLEIKYIIEFCLDHTPKYDAILYWRDPDWRDSDWRINDLDDTHIYLHFRDECPWHMPRFLELHRGHTDAMDEIYAMTATVQNLEDCYAAWDYLPHKFRRFHFMWKNGMDYMKWWIDRGYSDMIRALDGCKILRRNNDALSRFFAHNALQNDTVMLEWAILERGYLPTPYDVEDMCFSARFCGRNWHCTISAIELLFRIFRISEEKRIANATV